MPTSLKPAQVLGLRLRAVRIAAGLTGRVLAALLGRHPAKVSRIEHGHALPTAADVCAWCRHCGAAERLPGLLALRQAADELHRFGYTLERGAG